jgi:hypothetical protein
VARGKHGDPIDPTPAIEDDTHGVKGVSLLPAVTALLMPIARYLGVGLRKKVQVLIEERRESAESENLAELNISVSRLGQPPFVDSPGRSDLACSSASGSRSQLTSISRSCRLWARSQSRSCSLGLSSIHQKSDAGSIVSVFSTLHAAGSIRFSTAHRRSSSGAPGARNARCEPSRNPVRHRIESHRHRNRDVAQVRKSRQPMASSNPSNIPACLRLRG